MAPTPTRILAALLCTFGPLAGQDDPIKELAALQPKIDAAIDKGVRWLLGQQLRDGSWGSYGEYRGGATALAAYTLLKSGVAPAHSAIRRAVAFLGQVEPQETYTTGCMLMLLHALGRAEDKPRIQKLADKLVSWQRRGFGYPFSGDKADQRWSHEDLSNTQYAVLGLRAALQHGAAVKDEVWLRLADDVLRHQSSPETLGQVGTKRIEGTAFRYKASDPRTKGTGSMTAAGIAVLATCEEALGKRLAGELAPKVARAIDAGLAWLGDRFVPDKNPGSDGWVLYWLYGVERVGAYRKLEMLGAHPWYLEGARWLVTKQGGSGDWWEGHGEPDTCFALLFLNRASAPKTGGGERRARGLSADEAGDVHVKAQVGGDGAALALWVSGFAPAALQAHGGVRVVEVEYLAGGVPIARVAGDPARPWRKGEDFAAKWTLAKRGKYEFKARVKVAAEPPAVLESKGFTIDASAVLEPWMEEAATAAQRNLLRDQTVTVDGSTTNSPGQKPAAACDGSEATAWCCKQNDPDPWLVLTLEQQVRADTLVLTHLNGKEVDRDQHDRATKVSVRIQGLKEPIVATLPDDELAPAVIALPGQLPIKRLELHVLERKPGQRWKGHVGFAEIALR